MNIGYLAFCAFFAFAAGTAVNQCPGKSYADLESNVELMPCKKVPCRLKKGTTEHIKIKFTPEKNLSEMKAHVTADLFGVPLPFIGVDGSSVCDKIETEAGDKAPCPLEAGKTYIYKDSFPVLGIYPTVSLNVHWALQEKGHDVICFEVPARIA